MISYRVATSADDYAACRKLMYAAGITNNDLSFPTLMAIDDKGLLGFVGTTPRDDMVLAGPIVMRQDRSHAIVALRLAGMYEMTMKNMGISSFIFYADEKDSVFVKAMQRYFPNVKPYAKTGSTLFYSWHIDKVRQEQLSEDKEVA